MITKPSDIEILTECLKHTPVILTQLLAQIDPELYKDRRIINKWSIHEHACHIATGDKIGFIDRLSKFIDEDNPAFTPLSGESFPPDYYYNMDLNKALEEFKHYRKKIIEMVSALEDNFWHKSSRHTEYTVFTPYIMLRHRLLHDHLHLYRIEELWLTRAKIL